MPCKHSNLMMIYAQQAAECDEPWLLWEWGHQGEWGNLDTHPRWVKGNEYRQIQKTIRIGSFDVPEPMREKPEYKTTYWTADPVYVDLVCHGVWLESCRDLKLFKLGICHATKEAAQLHAKALFSFTEVK